jgi:hypothetical protein
MFAEVCPCNYCVAPKRHVGCHAHCKEYKDWSNLRQQYNAKVYAARHAEDDCFPTSLRKRRK